MKDGIRDTRELNSGKMPKEIILKAWGKNLSSIKVNKEKSQQILCSLMVLKDYVTQKRDEEFCRPNIHICMFLIGNYVFLYKLNSICLFLSTRTKHG